MPRQYADRRTTADEVEQHLPGHFLGKRRHALGDDAVVTGKNRDPHLLQTRLDPPLQTRQLHRQRFQLPEGAGRLGQLLLPRLGLFDHLGIDRLARVQPPGLSHNAVPFRVRGRPATVRTTR
ncbi:hypothetical protein D3C86_1070350 [compost metagenome]